MFCVSVWSQCEVGCDEYSGVILRSRHDRPLQYTRGGITAKAPVGRCDTYNFFCNLSCLHSVSLSAFRTNGAGDLELDLSLRKPGATDAINDCVFAPVNVGDPENHVPMIVHRSPGSFASARVSYADEEHPTGCV